jgi:hypothetical protein
MKSLFRGINVLSGLMVIILYWFDWNLCEKYEPNFDGVFWNNYVFFSGYIIFIICYLKNFGESMNYVAQAVGSSVIYGILIAAYKSAGSECGTVGEGMSQMQYYNTEVYPVYYWNNILVIIYAISGLFEPDWKTKDEVLIPVVNNSNSNVKENEQGSLKSFFAGDPSVLSTLIEKYNVSQNDLKAVRELELEQKKYWLFSLKRERLRKDSRSILRKYKMKFRDEGNIIWQLKREVNINKYYDEK